MSGLTQTAVLNHWIPVSGLTQELSSVTGQVHVQKQVNNTDCPVTEDSTFRLS